MTMLQDLRKVFLGVNWSEILDGVDANSDYDNFIKKSSEGIMMNVFH